jgi:hypothetical protein
VGGAAPAELPRVPRRRRDTLLAGGAGGRDLAQEDLELGAELRASPAAWDEYERSILAGRLAAAGSLGPEEVSALRERAHRWFREYEAHGRHCLGFAAYVAVRSR